MPLSVGDAIVGLVSVGVPPRVYVPVTVPVRAGALSVEFTKVPPVTLPET